MKPITYPFSFPLCDLLICEFNPVDAVFLPEVCSENVTKTNVYKPLHGLGVYIGSRSPKSPAAGRSLSALAELIYQKVIRRKPVPFLKSEKDLKNLGCYIVETLACGHTVEVHPSEIETLTARKRSCHECSGWFGGLRLKKPVQKVIGEARRKIKQSGLSPWPATVFATCLIVAGGLWLHARWPKSFFYSYPTNYLRVMQRLNDRDFMVQRVEAGLAQETTMMRFCADYLPWFEGGHILQWIRYDDHGSCQSIGPEDRGFDVVRDSKGLPVLAPNCHFDWSTPNGHVVCEGGVPKFD